MKKKGQGLWRKKDEKWDSIKTDQVNRRMGNSKKKYYEINNAIATFFKKIVWEAMKTDSHWKNPNQQGEG